MDSVGVNVIKTAALGRSFQVGMLYDCRKDALIPGIRLWNKEELEQNTCTRKQINTGFNITASDSIQDKSELLNIEGGLKLSVLGGLINVSGAAKYLKDTKTSFKQQRLTLHYQSTVEFKELIINQMPTKNLLKKYDDNGIATHVVTGVLYGADACFVFDREVSSDEDKKTVEGDVKVALEKLYGTVSVDANADLRMNDKQKNAVKNFTCTFYGDFQLPSNPTSFEDALNVFADLPKLLKENQELAVPLRVWLYPLDKLHKRASKLQKDISMDLIIEIESVIESLNTAEMKCSDLLKDSTALNFAEFHDKILQIKQNCYMYKLRLMKKLGSLLPNIRGDLMKETALIDLLQEHDESPFRRSALVKCLKERERESDIIKTILRQLKDYGAQVEDNIDVILMDLEVGNLVSYTFTSMDCSDVLFLKQKAYLSSTQGETDEKSPDSWLTPEIKNTMRSNLTIFKNLIDSKDCKPARFIVSSREMGDNPGSCILLYESECDEAVCFTPPSKPVCPVTEEVKGQSVVLKVVPPCPATVELRLLYKPKQDTVWTSEPVLKDQDTVTLTDLREETEYEIKCAALGKLNYTVYSDVITVKTERNMRSSAVRIVLLGKDRPENIEVGNFILGREAFDSEAPPDVVERVGGELDDTWIIIINSPQLLQTNMSDDQITRTVRECVYLSDPGPHAFILVLQYDFTEDDLGRVKYVLEKFSEEAIQRTIVITTDEETSVKGASVNINEFIQELTAECGRHIQLDKETEKMQSELSQQLKEICKENCEEFIFLPRLPHFCCTVELEGYDSDVEDIFSFT